jgi:hypothetical protein
LDERGRGNLRQRDKTVTLYNLGIDYDFYSIINSLKLVAEIRNFSRKILRRMNMPVLTEWEEAAKLLGFTDFQ